MGVESPWNLGFAYPRVLSLGVNSVEVRSTVAARFRVTPRYDSILENFGQRDQILVLT
jgi:hypothetical protein